MRKAIWKKGLAVVAIVMFFNLTLTSAVSTLNLSPLKTKDGKYCNDRDNYKEVQEKSVKAEITEYTSNGLIEKRVIALSQGEADELKSKLIDAETFEERFSILKEYGLILREISLENWKEGMYKKAEAMGLTKDKSQDITSKYKTIGIFKLPLLLNFLCKVNAIYVLSGNARLGLPPIVGLTKFFGSSRILSFDLIDMCWGLFGVLETKSLLRSHTLATIPSFMCLAGFVGMHIHIPLVLDIYSGFSAMTFAVGLGIHGINFNLLTMALLGFVLGGLVTQIISGFVGGEPS